jgi:hypothetical protein
MKTLIGLLFPSIAHAVTISTAIPGTNLNTTSSSPGAFVANIYQFALVIGGILAFGVIVYGGIRYMTSAGNPSAAGDAKEWIEAALLGLLLLAGAYFILGVVNPQLLNLNLPALQPANVSSTAGGTANGCGACGGSCRGKCAYSGYACITTGGNLNGYYCDPPTGCAGLSCTGSSGGGGASNSF